MPLAAAKPYEAAASGPFRAPEQARPGAVVAGQRVAPFSFGTMLRQLQGSHRLGLTLTPPPGLLQTRSAPQTAATRTMGGQGQGLGVIRDAQGQLGKPYVFGANDFSTSPRAFDCSSFTKWLYQRNGTSLPRTAQQQYQASRPVAASQASPGDLVFFRNTYATADFVTHVGVLLEGGRMISASGGEVGVQSLTDPFWASRLVGFGRPGGAAIATSAAGASTAPQQVRSLGLDDFPRPADDNGRGLHWVPTTASSPEVVDRFVREAADMKARWMVVLNNGAQIGANDYLVRQLVAKGILPVMRVYTPGGEPVQGDLTAMVRHYKALGVPYFQLFNEPNLRVENPDGRPSPERYVQQWVQAARQVVAGGGLPGFGALAPGGDYDDRAFLRRALELLKSKAEPQVVGRTWVALHNYTFNQPLDHDSDSYGFMAFKVYDGIIREVLGQRLPIIGTEGGAVLGNDFNKSRPAVTEKGQAEIVTDVYRYMKQQRESYNFAYTTWVIANEAGGGADPSFEHQALFLPDRARPLVAALKQLA